MLRLGRFDIRPRYLSEPFIGDSLPGTLHRTLILGLGSTLYFEIKSLAIAGSTNSESPFDVGSSDFLLGDSTEESFLGELELSLAVKSLFFSELFLEILERFLDFDFEGRAILFRFSLNNEVSS